MTTNFVSQDAVIDGSKGAQGDMYFLYKKADFVTFFHGVGDSIAVAENNATLNIQQASFTTIYDFGRGLHLNLDPFTAGTSIRNFQLDPTARIDLFSSPYRNMSDLKSHLEVRPGYGTVINSPLQGPPPLSFPGDYALNTSQIHLHPSC